MLRLGFELRVLKWWLKVEWIASALFARESDWSGVSNGEATGTWGAAVFGAGEVGDDSSVMENSASSYLGTAFR